MLITLSPAKTLDFDSPMTISSYSKPRFLKDSEVLIETLRNFSTSEIRELMKLSQRLAEQNVARYREWQSTHTLTTGRQAIMAFKGDVYRGLDATTLDAEDHAFAQGHLCILSGLYGVLRPLDVIQPHRLEMGARLTTRRGADLYAFWRATVTKALNKKLKESGGPLVNLASHEYFRSVDPKALGVPIVTPLFKEKRDSSYKTIAFHAKRARGLMARFAIQKRLDEVDGLRDFRGAGYRFNRTLSDASQWVFTRSRPA